jgi:hypothetical protein
VAIHPGLIRAFPRLFVAIKFRLCALPRPGKTAFALKLVPSMASPHFRIFKNFL